MVDCLHIDTGLGEGGFSTENDLANGRQDDRTLDLAIRRMDASRSRTCGRCGWASCGSRHRGVIYLLAWEEMTWRVQNKARGDASSSVTWRTWSEVCDFLGSVISPKTRAAESPPRKAQHLRRAGRVHRTQCDDDDGETRRPHGDWIIPDSKPGNVLSVQARRFSRGSTIASRRPVKTFVPPLLLTSHRPWIRPERADQSIARCLLSVSPRFDFPKRSATASIASSIRRPQRDVNH